jgi:lipoate-protein ligase A
MESHNNFQMRSKLIILPDRRQHPFRNMEEDLLLLYRNPFPDSVILRHYGWEFPCWTCGYSQKFAFVQKTTGGNEKTIFRRATGGGIVPHANDWTFSLVIGGQHPAFKNPPRELYSQVHKVIVETLLGFDIPATLHCCGDDIANATPAPECFRSPVLSDVLHSVTGEKIAGAAIKKTRNGILLQGSVQKLPIPDIDWLAFKTGFNEALAQALLAEPENTEWPFTPEDIHPAYGEQIHHVGWFRG